MTYELVEAFALQALVGTLYFLGVLGLLFILASWLGGCIHALGDDDGGPHLDR